MSACLTMLLCSLALPQAAYTASRKEEVLQVKGDRLCFLTALPRSQNDQKNLLTGSFFSMGKA